MPFCNRRLSEARGVLVVDLPFIGLKPLGSSEYYSNGLDPQYLQPSDLHLSKAAYIDKNIYPDMRRVIYTVL